MIKHTSLRISVVPQRRGQPNCVEQYQCPTAAFNSMMCHVLMNSCTALVEGIGGLLALLVFFQTHNGNGHDPPRVNAGALKCAD